MAQPLDIKVDFDAKGRSISADGIQSLPFQYVRKQNVGIIEDDIKLAALARRGVVDTMAYPFVLLQLSILLEALGQRDAGGDDGKCGFVKEVLMRVRTETFGMVVCQGTLPV